MKRTAFFGILIIPILWGIGFPLTHNAVQNVNPGVFAFYRQLTGAIILLPFAYPYFKLIDKKLIFSGSIVGLFTALNVIGQSYALVTLTSSTTAFFVTLNILFVPFLAYLFKISKISLIDLIAVALGILSIYVTFGGEIPDIKNGAIYGLLAALAIASNIVFIDFLTKNASINRIILAFISLAISTILLSIFPIIYEYSFSFTNEGYTGIIVAILYQGAITTALALFLQLKYQKELGGSRTAIILNLDLVFASLFGLVNSESLSMYQIIGGLIALIAALIHETEGYIRRKINKLMK